MLEFNSDKAKPSGFRRFVDAIRASDNPYFRFFRFLIAGGAATLANLSTLYLLTDFAGLWYLASASAAFVIGVTVSFLLQKFWTFRNHEIEARFLSSQFFSYLIVTLINLALNTALLYGLVEYLKVFYLAGQIIVSALIAFESYFVYRYIFKPR